MANEKKSGSKKNAGSKKKKVQLRDVAKARQALTEEMAKKIKGGRRMPSDW